MSFFKKKKFPYQQQLDMLTKLGYTNTKYNKKRLEHYKGDANKVLADYKRAEEIAAQQTETMLSRSSLSHFSPRTQSRIQAQTANDTSTPSTAFTFNDDQKLNPPLMQQQESTPPAPDMEFESKTAPPSNEPSASLMNPIHSITTNKVPSNATYLSSMSSLLPSLAQSETQISQTPEMTKEALTQQLTADMHEDVDIDIDDDDIEESKDSATPQPDGLSRSGSNLRDYHGKQGGYNQASRNLLDDDFWSHLSDIDLRAKMEDFIDDYGVSELLTLYHVMNPKVTKPDSKIRVKRIWNELKNVRVGLKDDNVHKNEVTQTQNEEEEKEELSLEEDEEINKQQQQQKLIANEEQKSVEEWMKSKEYEELKKKSTDNMRPLLCKQDTNQYKTEEEIGCDASNGECKDIDQCICVRRCEIVMMVYHEMKQSKLWSRVPIAPLISFRVEQDNENVVIYGYQQILEDFQHLQIIHAAKDRKGFQKLCERFEHSYPCDIEQCNVFARHYRDRTQHEESKNLYYYDKSRTGKAVSSLNDKDMIFQQHCDKIHSYLLHSMLKFDANGEKFDDVAAIKRRNQVNKYAQGRSFSSNGQRHKNHMKRKKKSERYIVKRASQIADSQEITKTLSTLRENTLQVPVEEMSMNHDHEELSKGNVSGSVLKLSETKSISNGVSANAPNMENDMNMIEDEQWDSTRESISFTQYSESDEEYELYPGIEEDREWTKKIEEIANDLSTKDHEIYSLLVEHMGIFRWQALHGFHHDQHRANALLQPTFKNIKEEVLKNDFHRITTENWNQTLRKAMAFQQSWAGKKIRTTENGEYEDLITGTMVRWKKDEQIKLKEVITLKLYTDFDQLQFELKKCFRYEQIGSLLMDMDYDDIELTDDEEKTDGNTSRRRKNRDGKAKEILEKRLMDFYHWRMSLQITLKKFGKAIHDMNLYHGVNEKMIFYPHATTQAFYGPLSTTLSFHVAKTFATDKGMVLKISSMYPRLYHCRAFDASLLSDYPEEQEWLVGFLYTRIRKVYTKERWDIGKLPSSTQLRFSFFVIHLFKLQVFSLSEDLAEILTFMLEMYLTGDGKKGQEELDEIYNTSMAELIGVDSHEDALNTIHEQSGHQKLHHHNNQHQRFWSKIMKRYNEERKNEEKMGKQYRWKMDSTQKLNCRIMSVLIAKFKSFAHQPKIVRIDDISYNLRHHFMDKIRDNVNNGKPIYRVSLHKIQQIFINVEEIYLLNYYRLDDELFESVLRFLENIHDGKKNKDHIKQIKFLYYDYHGDIKDNKENYFPSKQLNPQNVKKLQEMEWEIIEKPYIKRNTANQLVYGVGIRLKPITKHKV